MSDASAPYRHSEEEEPEFIQPGGRFGYGHWLQPIINTNDRPDDVPEELQAPASPPQPQPQRRGRGRPAVTKVRNDSAIEVKQDPTCFPDADRS